MRSNKILGSILLLATLGSLIMVYADGTINVAPGDPVTISWKVDDAPDCDAWSDYIPLDNNIVNSWRAGDIGLGKYDNQGSKDLGAATQLGTFILRCRNDAANSEDTVTLVVQNPAASCPNGATNAPTCTCDSLGANYHARDSDNACVPDPTATFYTNPSTINSGTFSQLNIEDLTNAANCSLAGNGFGPVDSPTTIPAANDIFDTPTLTSNQIYTLVCNNGSVESEKTWTTNVTVIPDPNPIITSFVATPNLVTSGQTSDLGWSTAGTVSSCAITSNTGIDIGSIAPVSSGVDAVPRRLA